MDAADIFRDRKSVMKVNNPSGPKNEKKKKDWATE